MKLRPATMDDAQILIDWRNDPVTQEASVERKVVSWEGHVAWLSNVLQNDCRHLYILVDDSGDALGTGRIDRDGPRAELSWTIAPTHRAKGVGKKLVELLLSKIPGVEATAQIKPGNNGSIKIAEANGFVLATKGEKILLYIRS